jgi:glycosyltransferase involved in cell wall biosynthesis
LYFFAERKREFYEKTSYDYFSIKRTMARILRFPVQLKDFINCRNADKIITNSIFSNSILNRTYGKKSIVIYPGMKHVVPINKKVANTDKAIIVGQLSYTKGYDIAFNLLSNAGYREVTVIGRKTDDFNQIINISSNLGIKINLLETEDDDEKDKLYKKHGVFIACQRNEPFGITTLEACYNNNIVFGLNEGGTSEIIHHGLNGFLFDKESIINASKLLSMLRIRKSTNIIKINTIDWRIMAEKIISISK